MKLTDEQRMLVESNLNLVHHVIHKKCRNIGRNEYEDIYQTGVIGLCKAVEKFDPTKGFAFSTFAARCITNEIYMMFRRQKGEKQYEAISLESTTHAFEDNDGSPFSETFSTIENADSMLFYRLPREMLDKRFDERDELIIKMSLYGVRQQDIAAKFGITQSYISRRLKRIQEIVRREHCRDDRVAG